MGNIISNINLSIAKGRNPTKVIKMQIQNAQNIRDYIDSKKAWIGFYLDRNYIQLQIRNYV